MQNVDKRLQNQTSRIKMKLQEHSSEIEKILQDQSLAFQKMSNEVETFKSKQVQSITPYVPQITTIHLIGQNIKGKLHGLKIILTMVCPMYL